MIPLLTFTTPPHDCTYLPGQTARLSYRIVERITPQEYESLMERGWRRFGHALFTHDCPRCSACQSLRIPTATFRMNRTQRRAWAANADLTLNIGQPGVTDEILDLYDRFHQSRSKTIGWTYRGEKDADSYIEGFVHQPFIVEEWQYRLNGRLVGVGYVDPLPGSLSAIYFFHEPEEHRRSLGTYNVLRVIAAARERQAPFAYLGYFVDGCRSLEYKARFAPNEILGPDGVWRPFRD